MIRTLHFICIIFVKNINKKLANINSESSRGGVWLEVLKCFVRGGQIFLLALCVCVWGGSVSVPLLP